MQLPRIFTLLPVTLALGCPGDLAGNPTTSTASSDPSTGHSDTGALTDATPTTSSATSSPEGSTSSTSSTSAESSTSAPAGTTAALDDTGAPDTSTGDTGTTAPDTSSSETGEPPPCGNGVLDPLEQCDDGDDDDSDACNNSCKLGVGDKGPSFPLNIGDDAFCITPAGAGLVLGSTDYVNDNDMPTLYADVQRLPLPQGAPAAWTYHESAGDYGRWPQQAATMSNGDVIIAGMIYTEIKKVDSGGYLWLARFTPAGALVWSRELKPQYFGVMDLELGADDRIFMVGRSYGLGPAPPYVAAFDPAGDLLWQFQAPWVDGQFEFLGGVTVGPDGRVYVAGDRFNYGERDNFDWRVLVRAFAADGAPLWETEQFPPDTVRTGTTDIVLTSDGVLVVASGRSDVEDPQISLPELALAGFSTAGAPLWWKQWAPQAPWSAHPNVLIASDDGGFHLFGSASFTDTTATLVARFAGDGAAVWTKLVPGSYTIDATRGPDDLLYVLTSEEISAYTP